ncbi:MAG: aminotransferase class V-fold PLP-dependent enzyme [Candidatus Omnitrophica bacterium]|nr:aminotransferase class V-fold PLP-dependent enzyme [Candidatus Omnitrophota bacterium]
MVNWNKIRKDFPITERFTYLDHASASPIPTPVYRQTLRYYDELGGFADFSWNRWIARREAVRRQVARLIGAEPGEIAFTTSTSHGMNLIAELIADKGGVLTNSIEFPATTVPWVYRGTKMKFIKPIDGIVDYTPHLNPPPQGGRKIGGTPSPFMGEGRDGGIKTILTSFVQFQNGFRQDLDALGKLKGDRFLVVNATQGFGYLPINVKQSRIDFLATNSYKWLMAGYGGGILYLRKKWIQKLKPDSCGWRSVDHPEKFDNRSAKPKQDASRYEYGCPPFPHIFAMGAAIEYLAGIGFENVWKRIRFLTDCLIERLSKEGFEILSPLAPSERSGIVVFRVKNAAKLTKHLLAKRIYVSPRGGGIRVAPHIYNTASEIKHLLKTLKEELRQP